MILRPSNFKNRFRIKEVGHMSNTEKKNGWVGVLNGQPKVGQFSERSRATKMSDIH